MTTPPITHDRTQQRQSRGWARPAAALLAQRPGRPGPGMGDAPRPDDHGRIADRPDPRTRRGIPRRLAHGKPVGGPAGPRHLRCGVRARPDRGRRPHCRRDPPRRASTESWPSSWGAGSTVLVVGLPMVVAAFWGAALARRQHGAPTGSAGGPACLAGATSAFWRAARGTCLVLATVAVVGLVGRPGPPGAHRPHPRRGRRAGAGQHRRAGCRSPSAGTTNRSCCAATTSSAPVLLFLEGGPGGTALGSMHYAGKPLEEHFMVATWDQRGTGKSASALEPLDDPHGGPGGLRHDRGDRVPARPLRRAAHLPARQLLGHDPGHPGRPGTPRPVPRLHRIRTDGRPAGDRHADVRRERGLCPAGRRHRVRRAAAHHRPAALHRHARLPVRDRLQPRVARLHSTAPTTTPGRRTRRTCSSRSTPSRRRSARPPR